MFAWVRVHFNMYVYKCLLGRSLSLTYHMDQSIANICLVCVYMLKSLLNEMIISSKMSLN